VETIVAIYLYTVLGGLRLDVKAEFKGPSARANCVRFIKTLKRDKHTLAVGCRSPQELADYARMAISAIAQPQ
jgi:hypothetical protein